MANKNPRTDHLTPGREAGGGESWRPSIYLPPELAQAIRAATEGMTTQKRSRTLGRWLMLGYQTERAFEASVEPSSN